MSDLVGNPGDRLFCEAAHIIFLILGMCPMPDPEDSIFKTSSIEVLSDPIPELFNVLTEEEDHLRRWTSHKYPVFFDIMSNSKHDEYGKYLIYVGTSIYNCF